MRAPEYRVILRESGTSFEPGNVIAEIEKAKNVGWSEYANDVGESFATLTQGDRKLPLLTNTRLRKGIHQQVYRDSDLVWAGWVGELDENETDVILYAYSYEAAFFWLHSDWNHKWSGSQVNTIVGDLWTRARTGISTTAMQWMNTGTIETPVTTSGGATAIVLPEYSINYKRILFALQELAGMSTSDTTNRVLFEVTPTGTFNFWKDRGSTRSDVALELGGNVLGYQRVRTPMDRRNAILAVGSSPRDIVLRKERRSGSDIATNSRREEALFYSWIRDEDEMDRINSLRLARGRKTDSLLALSTMPSSIVPARATGADFMVGDYIPVRIQNGITVMSEDKLITGQQIVVNRGVEHVRPIVQDAL